MISPKTIEEIKKRLIKTYEPLEIYLFGSYAWGNPHDESDLDFLIILEHCNPKDRYTMMAQGHKALLDIKNAAEDILVLSKQEFEQASDDKTRLFYHIKNKGKKIYDKDFESLLNDAAELTPHVTVSRYPDNFYMTPDITTANILHAQAQNIVNFVKK